MHVSACKTEKRRWHSFPLSSSSKTVDFSLDWFTLIGWICSSGMWLFFPAAQHSFSHALTFRVMTVRLKFIFTGEFVPTTTAGGTTLRVSNHESSTLKGKICRSVYLTWFSFQYLYINSYFNWLLHLYLTSLRWGFLKTPQTAVRNLYQTPIGKKQVFII